MKTKKELDKLSAAIGNAIRVYHQAIKDNLKESGKEHKVEGYDEDEDGMRLTIENDMNLIEVVIGKVRYNGELNIVEIHISEEDYCKQDYWCNISWLGDDEDYVNDNIIWD